MYLFVTFHESGVNTLKVQKYHDRIVFTNTILELYFMLTRAWLGGGYFEPPSRFSAIAAKLMDESSQNFQYLQMHQFYTKCAKKKFIPMIGRPWMTSEWRHVWPILMQNKDLQEPSYRAQFLS